MTHKIFEDLYAQQNPHELSLDETMEIDEVQELMENNNIPNIIIKE